MLELQVCRVRKEDDSKIVVKCAIGGINPIKLYQGTAPIRRARGLLVAGQRLGTTHKHRED
jgi:hypothetical protein